MTMKNAIIKYPGSKWSIAEWIINMFPEHDSYLEPYFGSGAVFFQKDRSKIETVNDRDGNVVNLFEWMRNDPEKLSEAIQWTPYARDIYDYAWEALEKEEDSLKRAVHFCASLMMGYGYRTRGKAGWKRDVQGREAAYAARAWCDLPQEIYSAAERLRGVQIENRNALDLIPQFNNRKVLIYADPPYLMGTRKCANKQYRFEMTNQEHEYLLDLLLAHKGPVVLSGYDSDLYNDRLAAWHKEEHIVFDQAGRRRKEIVWTNYITVEQFSLF